jgi:hypothetical protein
MTLSNDDYFAYLSTHLNFLYFVGQSSNLVPKNMDFRAFLSAESALKANCRDHFLSNMGLLDDYFSQKAGELSENEISILSGFRKAIMSNFIIFRCLSKYAVFIDTKNNKFYAVKALRDHFGLLVDHFPAVVSATILPYKNMIIYDGFLKIKPISFGPNIRYSLNEDYKEAKKNKQIMETL